MNCDVPDIFPARVKSANCFVAANGQPSEFDGKNKHQDEAEEEAGHCVADETEGRNSIVGQRIGAACRKGTKRDTEDECDRQGRNHEQQCGD